MTTISNTASCGFVLFTMLHVQLLVELLLFYTFFIWTVPIPVNKRCYRILCEPFPQIPIFTRLLHKLRRRRRVLELLQAELVPGLAADRPRRRLCRHVLSAAHGHHQEGKKETKQLEARLVELCFGHRYGEVSHFEQIFNRWWWINSILNRKLF